MCRGRAARAGRPRAFASRVAIVAIIALCAPGAHARAGEAGRAPAGDSDPYADELIAAARLNRLAEAPVWLALLHYEPTVWHPTPASLADSADFFLAPDGARDAQAELDATLRAFFAAPDTTVRDREHPQCVFVARYRWLSTQLAFDPRRLPPQACPKFAEWRDAIAPRSVTLVFAEAYMNNPASMFGHTLLRLDKGEERQDLLAYAVNFAADPGGDDISFAWKGPLGMYPGFFSVAPYYEKVAEYGDWDRRDLWEYALTLSPDEVALLVDHVWELRGVAFDYYFFDENCSYQLLGLLKVARPDLVYWRRFQWWAAPSDTLRAVVRDSGLLGGVAYRPSATSVLRWEAARLSPSSRELALAVARGEVAPTDERLGALPSDERALVLTMAHDEVRHSFLSRDVERKPAAERARQILLALSQAPHSPTLVPPVPVPAVRPDQGHGTARASLGAGWRRDRPFVQAQIRPAFHALLDPQGGYTAGAEIEFLAVALRVYGDDGEVRLQDFTVLDMQSLAPRDDLFQPISWRFATRVLSLLVPGSDGSSGVPGLVDRYTWRTKGGAGLAYELPWSLLSYGFLQADMDISGDLRDAISAGPGAEVGVYRGFGDDRVRAHLFAEVLELVLGQQHTYARGGIEQRLTLGENSALRFEVAAVRDYGESWVEGMLEMQLFW